MDRATRLCSPSFKWGARSKFPHFFAIVAEQFFNIYRITGDATFGQKAAKVRGDHGVIHVAARLPLQIEPAGAVDDAAGFREGYRRDLGCAVPPRFSAYLWPRQLLLCVGRIRLQLP